MPYAVTKNTCHACHAKAKIYFSDEPSPKVGGVYRYLCPGCGEIVYFHVEERTILVNGDESIPVDATMAMKKEFH